MEKWCPVPGAVLAYEVSNTGRVRRDGHVLAGFKDKRGYFYVSLHNGVRRNKRHHAVARLVAFAFLPPPRPDRKEVNHKDGDPANNRVENLEWVTHGENGLHAYRVLGRKPPRPQGNPKLTPDQVREIRQRIKDGAVARRLAAEYGVHFETIYKLKQGRTHRQIA